jgi:hypothetical protein
LGKDTDFSGGMATFVETLFLNRKTEKARPAFAKAGCFPSKKL